jgi:2-oxoglutarate/2-oxoacid ferredoxin oxidoreductase subunit alpha
MQSVSILIGGKAGDGIEKAASVIAKLLNRYGLCVFVHRDYPSLIRGGHTFSIIRAADEEILAHENKVDIILAINQDCIDLHKDLTADKTIIIFDPEAVKAKGILVPVTSILKELNAGPIFKNTCMLGALAGILGIEFSKFEDVLKDTFTKEIDLNIKIAQKAYASVKKEIHLPTSKGSPMPMLTGNEATGMGFAAAGLDAYLAYPMTPTSTILHFLAENSERFGIEVVHPESEIAVILMALGFAYAGKKTAVGTSGGGFCLMTEGLSFAGMAELPITIVLGQRPGPSTGLPTYTAQTELGFAINAGQGEFLRVVVAPGDAEEAYQLAGLALGLSWKYQVPSFVLTDKTLAEGTYKFDISKALPLIPDISPLLWDRKGEYKRYQVTDSGVSPLAFPSDTDAVVKISSYEHDESGITSEHADITVKMQSKRMKKAAALNKELESAELIKKYGNIRSDKTIIFWGSNKGACIEVADRLGIMAIQPLLLWPLPAAKLKSALKAAKKIILIENNYTGQLKTLLENIGIKIDAEILKFDGRPFAVDELESLVRKEI